MKKMSLAAMFNLAYGFGFADLPQNLDPLDQVLGNVSDQPSSTTYGTESEAPTSPTNSRTATLLQLLTARKQPTVCQSCKQLCKCSN